MMISRMKKLQFLLLDAGPIKKLFELGFWDKFIESCDVTISRIVANQAERIGREFDISIDLKSYEEKRLIKIFDSEPSVYKIFYEKFDQIYKPIIHPGERETLAFLYNSSENWRVCAADKAVFKVLGLLSKAEQGISLEEILKQIGLSLELEWKYTKKFQNLF